MLSARPLSIMRAQWVVQVSELRATTNLDSQTASAKRVGKTMARTYSEMELQDNINFLSFGLATSSHVE